MADEIRMTDEVEQKVTRRFRQASDELSRASTDLRSLGQDVAVGVGEFADVITDEAESFHRAWRKAIDVYARSASAIAENAMQQYADLRAVDAGRQ